METTIQPPPEIHNFLGPAEPSITSQAELTSEATLPTPCAVKDPTPDKENQISTLQGGTPTLGALQSQAPLFWQAASLSLHLGTTPPVTKPPLDVATFADPTHFPPPNQAFLAALQAGRAPPPGASHPLAVRALPHAETVSIRLTEPKTEMGGFLFPPQSLPAAHSARFMTRGPPSKRQGLNHERSPLEKNLASDPEVRDIIDALVVERLREFTQPGRFLETCCSGEGTQPPPGGASEREGSGQAQGNLETSARANNGERLANPVSRKEEEQGVKRERSRSRDSDAEGGRKKRARSRSRSSSPHEAQGGHDRVGGNREAVRKYREKKKVEFASMQNQLAQLHKRVALQEEELRQKAQIEVELVHLWRQVGALQEKVSSGQNLLVSELFAIKPPESLR